MSEVAIKVENLSKMYKLYDNPMDRLKESLGLSKKCAYKEHYALNDVNIEIEKGQTVGIIGTNGSGKSTILKIITGVLNPTAGNVTINGRISALLELGAGFNMEYTGIENVYLNGTMIGFTREEIDAKLDDILAFADIGDFVHQPVKTYSSGMFVRLAFAVAINIEPEILIVDEALSVGDVFFQAKCYKKFEEFKKMGKTILFVSHDLGSISKYCDKVVLLNKGVKLAEGSPKEMVDLYKKVLVNQLDDDISEEELNVQEVFEDVVAPEYVGAWKDNFQNNPNLIEYGDKRIEIVDYALFDDTKKLTSTIVKGTEFTLKIKIKAKQTIDEPIVAFTIKDVHGTEITGTNTMFEKVYLGKLQKGEERTVSFTQKLAIQGGQYLISLGCTGYEGDDFVVYHRLYDVVNLSIVSEKNTVGYYDMFSQIEVE